MEREWKGHPLRYHVDDYCVADLETTGIFVSSAKIIEISAVKVRSNQVVDEFSTLVNPHCLIPAEATAVNHITDEMVKDAPSLDEILDLFLNFVGHDVIVGYNNAGFDMNIIYDACSRLNRRPFSNDYIDILHMSRRCLRELDNCKLETVSKHYGLDTTGEHRALKDCYLTKNVYDHLCEEFGDGAFSHRAYGNGFSGNARRRTVCHTAETMALQELQSFLEEITADGIVTPTEFSALKAWMEHHRDLQGNYPFDRVFLALDNVLKDGRITYDELEDLQILFTDFADPVRTHGCHDEIRTIQGKHIVVSGEFEYGERNEVCALIEAAGGINDTNVKKATNYVVVGAKGSENWKTGKYGGKIQKAMELKARGAEIEIVAENDFILALKLILLCGASEEAEHVEDGRV